MPELPEVEAVCRKLRRDAVGACITEARLLRKPNRRLERSVAGREITQVARRGKNILLALGDDLTLRVHLRMTGNLYVVDDARLYSADVRAWFRFEDGRALVLEDPRALGVIELLRRRELSSLLESLGPEPLSEEFSYEAFAALARQSRQPAKVFLMDQSRVAGLGNIYAAEALHRARVHPAKPMNRLSARKLSALHKTIVDVLVDAVQSACIAYAGPGRFEARETFTLAAYGREGEPCPACGRRIRRMMQAGRSTYYCPGCQR